jgi:hypothetical protein
MSKIMVAVGFDFPGSLIESVSTNSDRSLLDADIIFFRPDISDFPSEHDVMGRSRTYQGARWISEQGSFALKRAIKHWQSQLRIAYEANKTIVVFLAPYEQVYVDTGERTHSGTGRNRHTTIMLDSKNNYEFLPLELKITASVGKGIKAARDLGFLTPLWDFLKQHLQYRVMLEGNSFTPSLLTRTGDKIVGGIVTGKGTLILWPDVNFQEDTFVTESGSWSKIAKQFGQQLVALTVETDKVARAESNISPTPEWATAPECRLQEEWPAPGSVDTRLS